MANHILAREDVIDDFEHVSVRNPLNPQRYFMSRSRSLEIVTLDDVMELTLDGDPVAQNGRSMYKCALGDPPPCSPGASLLDGAREAAPGIPYGG